MGWDIAIICGIYATAYSLGYLAIRRRVRDFNSVHIPRDKIIDSDSVDDRDITSEIP